MTGMGFSLPLSVPGAQKQCSGRNVDRAYVPGAAAEPQPLRLRTMLFFGIGCTAETIALTLYFMAPP